MNESLEDVIRMLREQIDALKVHLDNQRLLQHPDNDRIVPELIRSIDARQDRLEQLLILRAAQRDALSPDAPTSPPLEPPASEPGVTDS